MRNIISVLLALLTLWYVVAIVFGDLPENHRIDGQTLLVIVLVVLATLLMLRPEIFSRLKLLELSGFKLELLEQVKETQERQGAQLSDIQLILPLLLSGPERRHLFNLASETTNNYEGNQIVRTELRRIRSIGLIQMRNDKHVGDIADKSIFDLADFCELTPLGKQWVERISELEKPDQERVPKG